jgi:hypothetical protein
MFLLGMHLIREGDSAADDIDSRPFGDRPFGDPASRDRESSGKEKRPDELQWEGK